MKQNETFVVPVADRFVASPLRNSINLELNAPLEEVWALVGDPGRMPEYSIGLDRVDVERDGSGKCRAYVCHFKPIEKAMQGNVHRVNMAWYEPNVGWASLDEEPNAFGLQQSLTLITLERSGDKTILTWDMHFNAGSEAYVQLNISTLEQALNHDIAQNLLKKFGGRVLQNFVEGKERL